MRDEEAPRPTRYPSDFAATATDRRALLALSTLSGLTARKLLELAAVEGSASACLAAVRKGRAGSRGDRTHVGGIDPDGVAASVSACGARVIAWGDPEYPISLMDLADPPALLYARGRDLGSLVWRVAVVGSRRCSALGRDVAVDIGRSLASAGACVVSGAARGIDTGAHRGALDAAGTTVAVLGSGIDVLYPAGSRGLLQEIEAAGAIVTEYPPGIPAEPFRFPARNRIVAGIARALVVVEGAAGSGSMISVDHALDLGREVFAVPGPVTSPLSEVPLALIRDGAVMIRGADDLLADLGLDVAPATLAGPSELPPDELRVFEGLRSPCLPDAVARAASVSIPEAVAALIRLELRGLVRNVGGRYERRLSPRGGTADAANA
ncbi:MAG: DNA-processing protein DprA [Actinomycetota bacterium]